MEINMNIDFITDNKTLNLFVQSVIGEGKTSTVYKVIYENKPYAFKVQSEPMNILNASNNCNCLPHIYKYGKVKDSYGTLMEIFENSKSLKKYMYRYKSIKNVDNKNKDMLNSESIIRIGLNLLYNLRQIHDNGLEFPDLRPDNIACIRYDTGRFNFKFYDCDALRIPSNIYEDKVGKQHESFYSCIEHKHTYVDDLCSMIFNLITVFGGTCWHFKVLEQMAITNCNPLFIRLNQLMNTRERYDPTKYDTSPYMIEYRRLIDVVKKNVYHMINDDIQTYMDLKTNHVMNEELIKNNFTKIFNHLCKIYNINIPRQRVILGLYLLAFYLTEYSYSKPCDSIDNNLYKFIEAKLRQLNFFPIKSIDYTKFIYEPKTNVVIFDESRIYK